MVATTRWARVVLDRQVKSAHTTCLEVVIDIANSRKSRKLGKLMGLRAMMTPQDRGGA